MEDSIDDPQIIRLKLYYHHQLQQKEKRIYTLMSHQKIALQKLRHTLNNAPACIRTSCYLDLVSKLKAIEMQHEDLMQEYSKNHVFVTALLYGAHMGDSPRPNSTEEQKQPQQISPKSKSATGSHAASCNPYSALSGYNHVESSRLQESLVTNRKATPTTVSNVTITSRQFAACKLIKTLPSVTSPPVRKRALSSPDGGVNDLQSPGSLSIHPQTVQPIPSACFAQMSDLFPVQPLLPQNHHPHHQHHHQQQQKVSSKSTIIPQDDSPSCSSLDSSSTVFPPSFSTQGSNHLSALPQTHTDSNWLIAPSSGTMTNDPYASPAFDWNSERLPDFSVWS